MLTNHITTVVINDKPYNVVITPQGGFLGHDIAFAMGYGHKPTSFVQHIDGNTLNDHWENLTDGSIL